MKYIVKCKSRENGSVAFIERDGWGGILLRSGRGNATELDSMPKAIDAWCRASMLADEPRIYQVAEDGTETPLPTYAESLQSNAAANDALDPIVARQDAVSDPPLPLHVRAATAARIVHETLAGRDEAVELLDAHRVRREVAKEAVAKLREVLENGEYTLNSKIESALLDVEASLGQGKARPPLDETIRHLDERWGETLRRLAK